MDEWVKRALAKWPDVPALFGWLGLTRRGRWLIQGQAITHPRIIRTINRNYGVDEHGRWFFQNGPQRGYIELEYAPLVLSRQPDGSLQTHSGLQVESASGVYLDEEGSVVLTTEHGACLVSDHDLAWILDALTIAGNPVNEDQLGEALAQASGEPTRLEIELFGNRLPLQRCDAAEMEAQLGFVRKPEPAENERSQ